MAARPELSHSTSRLVFELALMISSLNIIPSKSLLVTGERDEMTAESNSLDVQASCSDLEECLEGILYVRKGRSSGISSWSWNRRHVVFRFEDGGSISAYNAREQVLLDHAAQKQIAYSNFHRRYPPMDDSQIDRKSVV